ncbi:hypothetical protein OKW46_000390 [Paraburkholderia sp. WSM4179]|nr:hypothetical protein [Paraburkholderia sp. WSM4179]
MIGRLGARVTQAFDIASGRLMPYPVIEVLYAFAGGKNVEMNGTNTPKSLALWPRFLPAVVRQRGIPWLVAGC